MRRKHHSWQKIDNLYNKTEIVYHFGQFGYSEPLVRLVLKKIPAVIKSKMPLYRGEDFPQIESLLRTTRKPVKQKRAINSPITEQEDAGLYTVKGGARYLGIPVITFRSWLENNTVDYPNHAGPSGINYYTRLELENIRNDKAEYFARREPRTPKVASSPNEKLYNVKESAEYLDVPLATFRSWLKAESIAMPNHIGQDWYNCYTVDELEAIKKQKADYFRGRLK
jgi:hypothetical protein